MNVIGLTLQLRTYPRTDKLTLACLIVQSEASTFTIWYRLEQPKRTMLPVR